MGRIKTAPIKRISIQLMRYYKDRFTNDYEQNKKVTNELVDLQSKKLRNIIAGYVTRMVKEGKEIIGGK